MTDGELAVELSKGRVDYGGPTVLHDVDLRVDRGAIHVLLGESGSGKTTLLRAIAGFEPLVGGSLRLFGTEVAGGGRETPPEERHVGVVFQDYALFPHLDVAGNLAFGMKRRDDGRIDELLAAVGLDGYRRRAVSALSGGEQQRVALARSLAQSPRLILFDEPFSNLNRDLRRSLRRQTVDILRERDISAVFVTHDREEAFAVATSLSVMASGRILQTGAPRELYDAPETAEVALAVGDGALITALGDQRAGTGEVLVARPEHLAIEPDASDGAEPGTVTRVEYAGDVDRIEIRIGDELVRAAVAPGAFAVGDEVGVRAARRLPGTRYSTTGPGQP